MTKWISRAEVLAALRVRPQTLYAYVSRGKIGVQPDPADPRRSLYRAEDVAGLTERRARGRTAGAIATSTLAMGEPVIATTISTIMKGRLYYRGRDAIDLSATATLEDAAALLWDSVSSPVFGPGLRARKTNLTARAQAYATLADAAAHGSPTFGRTSRVLHSEAATLVGRLATAFGAAGEFDALHDRLARAWSLDAAGADLVRRALVLLADHELTASAFASRVTASTGASLGACTLTGFAALSGPLQGDATVRVRSLIEEVERVGVEVTIGRHLASGLAIPGFGHPLYPDGDSRAASLLAAFSPPVLISGMIAHVGTVTGSQPTIDVALAALAVHLRLPTDAPFALFAIGRSIGWLAHSLEQVSVGRIIRPRARYSGPTIVESARSVAGAPRQ